jgi:hypothetical protein
VRCFISQYASSAFTKAELKAPLAQARRKNDKLGVKGILLYQDGNFLQVVEGEQDVVGKLVETIERDARHRGVFVFLRGKSEQRLFPDWTMGFHNLTDHNAAKTHGYTEYSTHRCRILS